MPPARLVRYGRLLSSPHQSGNDRFQMQATGAASLLQARFPASLEQCIRLKGDRLFGVPMEVLVPARDGKERHDLHIVQFQSPTVTLCSSSVFQPYLIRVFRFLFHLLRQNLPIGRSRTQTIESITSKGVLESRISPGKLRINLSACWTRHPRPHETLSRHLLRNSIRTDKPCLKRIDPVRKRPPGL